MASVFACWNEGKLAELSDEIHRQYNSVIKIIIQGPIWSDTKFWCCRNEGDSKWACITLTELGMLLGIDLLRCFWTFVGTEGTPWRLPVNHANVRIKAVVQTGHGKEIFAALYASETGFVCTRIAVLQRAPMVTARDLIWLDCSRMWRGGCIIQYFPEHIAAAFEAKERPEHLLLAPYFEQEQRIVVRWENLVAQAGVKNHLFRLSPSFELFLYSLVLKMADLPANSWGTGTAMARCSYIWAERVTRSLFHENRTDMEEIKSGTYNV